MCFDFSVVVMETSAREQELIVLEGKKKTQFLELKVNRELLYWLTKLELCWGMILLDKL